MLWWTKRKLQSGDPKAREAAVRELAQSADPSLLELLLPAFDDKSPDVRRAAVEALAKSDRPEVRPRLVTGLSDKDARVREAAGTALAALGWKPEDKETRLQFAIARRNWKEVLEYGEPGFEAVLQAAGDLGDQDMARAANHILVSLGDEAVELLLQLLKKDLTAGPGRLGLCVVVAGVEILGELGDARAVQLLADELKHFARAWNMMQVEPAPFDLQDVHDIYQKAIWETVGALISCGEAGVRALVDATKEAEERLREWYIPSPSILGFSGRPEADLDAQIHAQGLLQVACCQLEAMVYAPLVASQLKIAPETPRSQLAQKGLADLRKFARIDYKVPRVMNIVSAFAGVPVTAEMIR